MQYIALEKRFVGNLHLKIALTLQKLAATEKKLAAARGELLTAAQARKVIERLKEKQFARWRMEQERKDAEAMDEIGTQLAMRQARVRIERCAATPLNILEWIDSSSGDI